MFSVVKFLGSTTVGRGGAGARVGGASAAGGMSPRLHCHCFSYLWLQVPLLPEGWSHMHHLPCCHQVLWYLGLRHPRQKARSAGTISPVSLVPPPLSAPVHPSLDVQMGGMLQNLVCWIGASWSCGYSTGCRVKGREKGSISISRAADVSLPPLSFLSPWF